MWTKTYISNETFNTELKYCYKSTQKIKQARISIDWTIKIKEKQEMKYENDAMA